ncbi:MAG: penicillin acylase family protein [Rhodospirillaceae bacterium]|nr:penicillin acylase family protein [Rhodospirillaceae bacterium]
MNRVKSCIAYLVTLVVIGIFGITGWALSSLPPAKLTLQSRHIRAPVQIYMTDRAVPYIHAVNYQDAAFALGYVHAQNRMWQMEMMRRAGAGRLSEILGARTIATDRYFRTLGIYQSAEASYSGLSGGLKAHLNAYAAGVNRWIGTHPGALPPEFLALRHSPEPWRPADSLVWGKLMGLQLSGNYRGEMLRARLLRHITLDQVDALWPKYAPDAPVTIAPADQSNLIDGGVIEPLTGLMRGADTPPAGASNAWAVSGAHTNTGAPLLANDPHLGFAAPILWYLVKIILPGGFIAGATVPGVPLVIAGHNQAIAWGLTATQSDVQDLYRESAAAGQPGSYETPDGPRPYTTRDEVIRVRGGDDIPLRVRSSRHGPVISEAPEDGALALSATFLRADDRTADAIYKINLARGKADFLKALEAMNGFQLNFTYADNAGSIGFYAAGKVPIRNSGNGFYMRPGGAGNFDWKGFIPFEELPHQFDPASGIIVNANNAVAGPSYPYFLSRDWAAPYRARRITELLGQSAPFTLEKAGRMQADAVSLMVRDLVGPMTRFAAEDARLTAAQRMLRDWDGTMARDRPEPLIFTAWLRAFNKSVYADELGEDFRSYWRLRPQFIQRVLLDQPHWCDRRATEPVESCDALLATSLGETLDQLAQSFGTDDVMAWQWGARHLARFRHPIFGDLPIISTIADLQIPSDGGDFTINRGATRPGRELGPYDHIHGPGYRAVYDLKTPGNSSYVIATGQSGNPLSKHYRDFLKTWRDVRYIRLNATRAQLKYSAKSIYRFEPGAPE